jgi:hypothetical protein
MATTMTINGTSLGPNFPLIGTTIDNIRQDEQGTGLNKITLNLSGFIDGCDSTDVFDRIKTLQAALKKNMVEVTITVGTTNLYTNKMMYVQNFNDPEAWKEQVCDYNISLYFFEAITDANDEANFGEANLNGYALAALPSIGRQMITGRLDFCDNLNRARQAIKISMSGFIPVTGIEEAFEIQEDMRAAFYNVDSNGYITIGYNEYSQSCKPLSLAFAEVTPKNQMYYTAEMEYWSSDIISVTAKRVVTRINMSPRIKKKPICNQTTVQLLGISNQTITYSISVKAVTMAQAISQLSTEVALRVGGGVELEGGTFETDENTNTASTTIILFYVTPVIGNP